MEYLASLIYGLVILVLIGGLIYLGTLFLQGYLSTGSMSDSLTGVTKKFFGPRPEKRLAVVDQANVDGRRRLVLVRRDDVEHLIMTGGPVDVVIETGIGQEPARQPGEVVEVYPRAVGQAAKEQ
jgi:hypothetical protein